MRSAKRPRWLLLRIACALGVLALLPLELSGRRTTVVVAVQALLILGIISTSALDLRDIRRKRAEGPDEVSR
jgi:predicted outer membrane lipoprotein